MGEVIEVLPAPWNARTRVHEYGGRPWTVDRGALIFANFADQRLWRVDPGADPVALTPEPAEPAADRYAELMVVGAEVWCVRERYIGTAVVRRLVAVALDGSCAVRELAGGNDFLAAPTLSPDGRTLVWIGWDHPQMPWDGTTLWLAPVSDGQVGTPRAVLGGSSESVLQPEWLPDGTLVAVTDATGWWNLVTVDAEGTCVPWHAADEEYAGPLWMLGQTSYVPLDDGSLLAAVGARLQVLDHDGTTTDLDLPAAGWSMLHTDGQRVVAVVTPPDAPPSVVALDVAGLRAGAVGAVRPPDPGGALVVVSSPASSPVGPEWVSLPQRRSFPSAGGRSVHALMFPPRSPVATAGGELPPYVVFVHGGPTAQASSGLSLERTYFTSRGIGVIDVDYGGSSGYGRSYRDALRGQWGVVDVEDCIAAVRGLADAGEADGARLVIRGGSAGGWTVLAALTGTDAFAAGTSYYGVAELVEFARETHDFESRYLDGLIGPLPQAADLYHQRSPLAHVDGLSTPVLLLQGDEDEVVPPAQAALFAAALAARSIPHAYLLFEGEQHGFRRAENVITSLEAELSFYGQILGFSPPDVPLLALITG